MKRWWGLCITVLVLGAALAGCGQEPGYPEDGYAEGEAGDAMHTYFFDYTLKGSDFCAEFEGTKPTREGDAFWIAEVSVTNTGESPITMYDVDFRAEWGEGDLYDAPITYYTAQLSEEQLPVKYELQGGEERTGLLVFEIPAETEEVLLTYQEAFENGTKQGELGDRFAVRVPLEALGED